MLHPSLHSVQWHFLYPPEKLSDAPVLLPPLQLVWILTGMTQYDHLGEIAFYHTTVDKWENVTNVPLKVDLVTGPLPNRSA
jgi:hypothetical protein